MHKPSDVGNGHIQAHPHHCHIQQLASFRFHFFTIRSSLCRFRFVALVFHYRKLLLFEIVPPPYDLLFDYLLDLSLPASNYYAPLLYPSPSLD